jgi:citrate lyase subunit beta/citryl-CoA lyase
MSTPFAWGRSLLFCPCDQPSKYEKALSSSADTVVFDLEDGVDGDSKTKARQAIESFLSERDISARVAIRVNPIESDNWDADMAVVAAAQPGGVVFPKVRPSQEGLRRMANASSQLQRFACCATIESTAGASDISALLSSYGTFDAISWGPFDLAGEMGIRTLRSGGALAPPLEWIRSSLLVSAAAQNVTPLESVTLNYKDVHVVASEAAEAANLGFRGKFAIHPAQVEPIHEGLQLDPASIAWAEKAMQVQRDAGSGASGLDGEMLDEAVFKRAEHILNSAARLGVQESISE